MTEGLYAKMNYARRNGYDVPIYAQHKFSHANATNFAHYGLRPKAYGLKKFSKFFGVFFLSRVSYK